MYQVIVLVLLAGSCLARQINNPISEKQIVYPSPVKFKDNYYLIDEFQPSYDDTFTLLVSKDLQNWETAKIEIRVPETDFFLRIEEPELHVISDNQFRIYYSRYGVGVSTISALYSTNILGPYYISEKPIIEAADRNSVYAPTLFNSYGVLFLAWWQYDDYDDFPATIYAQQLLPDGLSAANEPAGRLINGTLPWESGSVLSPFIIQRGDYFYLFYNGIMDCRDDTIGVGVARSLFPLGPYEKFGDPIIDGNKKFKTPRFPYIVKDIDDKTDVLIYGCSKTTADCMTSPFRYACANTISWSKDNWPVIDV